MKLIRFGEAGKERPGIQTSQGDRFNVSGLVNDYDEDFFEHTGIEGLKSLLEKNPHLPSVSLSERLGAPLKKPSKIVCIGLNYAKHAEESGMEKPAEPIVFFKATSAMCGSNDNIILPKNSSKVDWEVELAVVIGKKASYVEKENAMDYVAGYCIHNDVSERGFQLERGGQWVKGKSADSFAPLGPWLVTADEVENPHNLDLVLKVNNQILQSSNTSDLIFDIPYLISYLSQFMTLLPGDIISTGTPSGVGLGFKPPRYLVSGDVVELEISGLGKGRQEVIEF